MVALSIGSYRLIEQIESWAAFAEISVSIVDRADGRPLVSFDEVVQFVDRDRDIVSIEFGATYALDSIPNTDRLGVFVRKLVTQPVDTSSITLAYATCHAVLACFKESPVIVPYFDRNSRSFVFPSSSPID